MRKGKEQEAAQGFHLPVAERRRTGGCQHQLLCGFQERNKLSPPVSHPPSCLCQASLAPELAQPLLPTGKGEGLSYHETLEVGFETTQDQDLQHQLLSRCPQSRAEFQAGNSQQSSAEFRGGFDVFADLRAVPLCTALPLCCP